MKRLGLVMVGLLASGAAEVPPKLELCRSTSHMNSNHFIIGLGGTGRKIIRAYRKTVYQEFRQENPSDTNLAYLYVDSSSEMMGIDDPTWKILNLAESVTKIDMESADLIRQHANHVLERDYSQESQRAELQKQVVSTVEEVKMSRGNNVGDDVYRQFLEGSRLAVKILKREN